jgi:beta-glucosidase
LSYTQFQYSNMRINPAQIYSQGNATVQVDVQNVGSRPGVETVQLYLHERFAPISTPVKQLRGFARVALAPGEKKRVSFTLTPKDLMLLDRTMHWIVVPGTFDIMVGKSSADIELRGSLNVLDSGGLAGYR